MKTQTKLHRPLWYFLPFFLAAIVVAVMIFAVDRYGSKISDLMQIMLKMVVIQ